MCTQQVKYLQSKEQGLENYIGDYLQEQMNTRHHSKTSILMQQHAKDQELFLLTYDHFIM
jgi:hypothetical protein